MTPEESKIADALFARVVFLATPESRDAALETAVTTYLHFLQACEARERLENATMPGVFPVGLTDIKTTAKCAECGHISTWDGALIGKAEMRCSGCLKITNHQFGQP